ncbi:MAG TPA: hypothetical protein VK009_10770 [Chloroflexota bacterium]|nr:hypothetical protein [Chloroflexota bacterium]
MDQMARSMDDSLPMVMNLRQLADYAHVCEDTVRHWMQREHDPLPHMRLSDSKFSRPLFRRDLFDDWQRRQMARVVEPVSFMDPGVRHAAR